MKENIIIHRNPVFRLMMGLCPTLAITTTILNSITIGIATLLVLTISSLIVSMLKKFIAIRIPIYVAITAGLTTIIQLLIKAFIPEINTSLGIYIPLISVNCLILSCLDVIIDNNINALKSASNSLCIGVAFAFALLLIGIIREILGFGSILGINISIRPIPIFVLSPGGLFILGIIIAMVNRICLNSEKNCNGCEKCNNCSEKE